MRAVSYGEHYISWLDSLIEKVRLAAVHARIVPGITLLDLGCGYKGQLLKQFSPIIKRGVGVDLRVDKQSTLPSNIKLLSQKVDSKLELEDNQFDLVTALAVVEHVERPDIMLSEARRVAKPGGRLMLTTPSADGKLPLELMAKFSLISQEEIADHKRYYTPQSLKKELENAGWKNVQVKRFGILYLNLKAEAEK